MEMIKQEGVGRTFDYVMLNGRAYALIAESKTGFLLWRTRSVHHCGQIDLSYSMCATMEDFIKFYVYGRNAEKGEIR